MHLVEMVSAPCKQSIWSSKIQKGTENQLTFLVCFSSEEQRGFLGLSWFSQSFTNLYLIVACWTVVHFYFKDTALVSCVWFYHVFVFASTLHNSKIIAAELDVKKALSTWNCQIYTANPIYLNNFLSVTDKSEETRRHICDTALQSIQLAMKTARAGFGPSVVGPASIGVVHYCLWDGSDVLRALTNPPSTYYRVEE